MSHDVPLKAEDSYQPTGCHLTFVVQPEQIRDLEAALPAVEEALKHTIRSETGFDVQPMIMIECRMTRAHVPYYGPPDNILKSGNFKWENA